MAKTSAGLCGLKYRYAWLLVGTNVHRTDYINHKLVRIATGTHEPLSWRRATLTSFGPPPFTTRAKGRSAKSQPYNDSERASCVRKLQLYDALPHQTRLDPLGGWPGVGTTIQKPRY